MHFISSIFLIVKFINLFHYFTSLVVKFYKYKYFIIDQFFTSNFNYYFDILFNHSISKLQRIYFTNFSTKNYKYIELG